MALTLTLTLTLALACEGEGARSERAPPCPGLHHEDAARTGRIDALLASAQLALPRGARVCFGPTAPSEVSTDGVLRIDARLGDEEAAARAAHLALHLRAPVDAAQPCDDFVEATLHAEAEALALEVRLRRLWAARAPSSTRPPFVALVPLPLEQEGGDVDVTPARVLSWLRTHPEGGPGVRAVAHEARVACLNRSPPRTQ